MALMRLQNGAVSTTSVNAQTDTDSLITPANLAGFPNAPQFTLVVRETGELLLVTAINIGTPNTWTVTRAFGGSAAVPVAAGSHLDYSLTREMLLGGFVSKLDEVIPASTSQLVTLTVPTLGITLRKLQVVIDARHVNSNIGNTYLQCRFGGESSALYDSSYAYWGSGWSYGNWGGLTYGRCAWIGGSSAGGGRSSHIELQIANLADATRWTTWLWDQHLSENTDTNYYRMLGAGRHRVAAAYTSIQLTCDNGSNAVWQAGTFDVGSSFTLYGWP